MYTAMLMKCHFIITLSDSGEIPVLCTGCLYDGVSEFKVKCESSPIK